MRKIGRVMFARVGWMHFYKGVMPGDERLIGGGKWNEQHIGGEVFNFRAIDGLLYGYVEPKGTINIGRIDPGHDSAEKVNHTLVVFVARRPGGGQVIVGWYEDALVLHQCVRWDGRAYRPTDKRVASAGRHWNVRTKASKGLLVSKHMRTFDGIPAVEGGMGQANVCYVYDRNGALKKQPWIARAVEHVRSYDGPNLLTDPLADTEEELATASAETSAASEGQGFAQDPKQRRAVENLAMSRAMAHFRKRFNRVIDVHANHAYDLHCSGAKSKLKVEVKGTTGGGDTVFLTRGEVALAKAGGCALFDQDEREKGHRRQVEGVLAVEAG